MQLTSLASVVALLTSLATAQVGFDPNLGTPLGAGDDAVLPSNALGFSFIFPDGLPYSAIDIDSNGRVFPPGGDTSDGSETLAEFLGQTTQIAVFWDDLDPSAPDADDVYFNTYHNGTQNVAVVTWNKCINYNLVGPAYTCQLQLYEDQHFVMYWDVIAPFDEPIVGVTSGNGAANPGSTSFSSSPIHLTNGVATIYQDFPAWTFDLQGSALEFTPDTLGGYLVNYIPLDGATAVRTGQSCITGINFTPDLAGGYAVTRSGSSSFDPVFGASVLTTGDDVISPSNSLGFTFTWPGGTTTTTVDIDTNGRLLPPGSDASDFSPDVNELLSEAHATIAPFWADFTFSLLATDNIFMKTAPGSATITWDGVPQYDGRAGATPMTVQATLRSDGSFTFAYKSLGTHSDAVGNTGDTVVGCSAGFGALDPGESDFAAGAFAAGANVYEFWDGPTETLDLQLRTNFLTRPILGGSFDLQIDGIPAGTVSAALLIGFSNVNTGPLDVIGMPTCFLYSSSAVPAVGMTFAGSTSSVFGIVLGTAASTLGIPLVIQAATVTPGISGLPVVLGNAIEAVVGDI